MSPYRKPDATKEEESAMQELKLGWVDRGLLLSMVIALWIAIGLLYDHQTVVEANNPVTVTVEPADRVAPTDHGEFDTDTGEFIRYPDGTGMEEDFRHDCQQVCTMPRRSVLHSDPPAEPGHVLYVDPAHMICACFHPGDYLGGDGVDRYVGWRHQLR